MLRACSHVITLSAVVVALSTAQAAEPQTLTLACKGTMTIDRKQDDAKPEPISMGIIVNFTNRKVQGFGHPGIMDYPVKITAWNDATRPPGSMTVDWEFYRKNWGGQPEDRGQT